MFFNTIEKNGKDLIDDVVITYLPPFLLRLKQPGNIRLLAHAIDSDLYLINDAQCLKVNQFCGQAGMHCQTNIKGHITSQNSPGLSSGVFEKHGNGQGRRLVLCSLSLSSTCI